MENYDIKLLLESYTKKDLINATSRVVDPIVLFIDRWSDVELLPRTIGLFGGWGQGKTAALAALYKKLQKRKDVSFIYFNAWKYAGRCEMIPTVIYKILQLCGNINGQNYNRTILESLACFGGRFGKMMGDFTKHLTGVSIDEIVNAVLGAKRDIESLTRGDILDSYFEQVDRIQRLVGAATKDLLIKKPNYKIVIAVDELDRCDPEEAFSVIKELRILFALRGIPLVFILCTNPQPIGEAIRHMYGFGEGGGSFNPNRIMEKFVDDFVTTYEPTYLNGFIRSMFVDRELVGEDAVNYDHVSYLHRLEARINPSVLETKWSEDTETHAIISKIDTGSEFYSNLRVLRKCFASAVATARSNREMGLIWFYWHLNILQHVDTTLRMHTRRCSAQIVEASVRSYVDLFKTLKAQGNENPDAAGYAQWPMIMINENGRCLTCTPYSYYRMRVYEHIKKILNLYSKRTDWESHRISDSLRYILEQTNRMEFVVQMTIIDIDWQNINVPQGEYEVSSFDVHVPGFQRYGYLLFYY